MNRHRTGFTLNFDTFACQFIEFFAVFFDCTIHRRQLLNVPDIGLNRGFHILQSDMRRIFFGECLPFCIVGICFNT